MNKRRKLMLAFGAGALAAPFASFGQQPARIGRIGYLSGYRSDNDVRFAAFKQKLRDLGHVEGKTISIDYLSTEAVYDRLPSAAAELVRRNVDVIMATGGTPAVTAARNATTTIPIVFAGVADPVGQGIVASLARPGGNITGATDQSRDTAVKSLSLLKEMIPSAKRIAILTNPTNSSLVFVLRDMQAAAKTLRLEITVVNAKTPADLESAFAEIARGRHAALAILSDAMFFAETGRLVTLAEKHRLPTMGRQNVIAEQGGLMSYGSNPLDLVRSAAVLVDKILKGAKPGDLPIEQPTKFELVINRKTAKALGITIPPALLISADKVIE